MTKDRVKQAAQLARAGRLGKAALVLAGFVLFAAAAASAADADYHPARTPAEQAVKHVMDIDDEHGDPFQGTVVPDVSAFRGVMTAALIAEMTRLHRAELNRNCHGKAQGDGYCSWDIDPIECTDAGGEPRFRTIRQEKTTALVGYTWGMYTSDAAQYRMVLAGGVWRLDGINCVDDGLKFNWK